MTPEEFRRGLRKIITGCSGCDDDACIYCTAASIEDVDAVMDLCHTYMNRILGNGTSPLDLSNIKLWDAYQVAVNLDLKDENSARATMSRAEITIIRKKDPETGQMTSYYPATEVLRYRHFREPRTRNR
jgi:hypothetical protein